MIMGYVRYEIKIVGNLSSHNSPQDTRDAKAWNGLVKQIRELAEKTSNRDDLILLVDAEEADEFDWEAASDE